MIVGSCLTLKIPKPVACRFSGAGLTTVMFLKVGRTGKAKGAISILTVSWSQLVPLGKQDVGMVVFNVPACVIPDPLKVTVAPGKNPFPFMTTVFPVDPWLRISGLALITVRG